MSKAGNDKEYVRRTYRAEMLPTGLVSYGVTLHESDLFICTRSNLGDLAMNALREYRAEIEEFIERHPRFRTTYRPYPVPDSAPAVVREMGEAAEMFDVGPMAAVAGAVAERVGRSLLPRSPEVIVENGGDIFLAGDGERRVRIFAGEDQPLLDLAIPVGTDGIGLCTSSASIGPSHSLGKVDAVSVLAETAAIADAAATAIGNRVKGAEMIGVALEFARRFSVVKGVVILAEGNMGAWGDIIIHKATRG